MKLLRNLISPNSAPDISVGLNILKSGDHEAEISVLGRIMPVRITRQGSEAPEYRIWLGMADVFIKFKRLKKTVLEADYMMAVSHADSGDTFKIRTENDRVIAVIGDDYEDDIFGDVVLQVAQLHLDLLKDKGNSQ